MKPVISIVTGTYNRLQYLQHMMRTVKESLPVGVPYEFVIIDGGSTDGSLEWLRKQPDVVLIEDGALLGAINAFTRGAYTAQGDYVVMANDDIAFHPESFPAAIAHLEDHPYCGAVAFLDNRKVSALHGPDFYKVQQVGIIDPNGKERHAPYPQVGMIRKWLGDAVDWWGANDHIMSKARTYGGDNYLGARIWESGYTVDVVDACKVDDYADSVVDELRYANQAASIGNHPDSVQFRRRFAELPRIPSAPVYDNPQTRRLRIAYFPIYEPGRPIQKHTKHGLRDALQKVGLVWEHDYLHDPRMLPNVIDLWKPDLVLSQFHTAQPIYARVVSAIRQKYPNMLWLNWNGDAFRSTDDAYVDLLKQVDLQLVVDATHLDEYAEFGIRAEYWQIGYEEPGGKLPDVPEHDIVFLANNYGNVRPQIEKQLRLNGFNVGLYGENWEIKDGACLYDFATGAALYKNAKCAIGDIFPNTRAFVSNRFFQALEAGVFMLQQHAPDFEQFNPGIRDGEHYVSWTDLDDLNNKLHYWLDDKQAQRRAQIARAGQEVVQANYSFDAQVGKLFHDILPRALGGER